METYGMELRQRVMDDYMMPRSGKKMTQKALAEKWQVSLPWVKKILKQWRQTGSLEPIKAKYGPRPKLEPHRELLKQIVAETPDATLAEIQEKLPVRVSIQTVANELRKLKLSFKKSSFEPPSKTARTSPKSVPGGKFSKSV